MGKSPSKPPKNDPPTSQPEPDPKPRPGSKCNTIVLKVLGVLLCLAVMFAAVAEMVVAVFSGATTKLYSEELSGRLVAMIVLALTAAVSLASSIYALVGLFKKQKKAMHVSGAVIFVMAIIQAMLCGIAVKVTPHDEATLSNSLASSFEQALQRNSRHMKLWDYTNHAFNCCGFNGPDDYRDSNMPKYIPNIPISCCRNYDPSKSSLVQEKELAECKQTTDFYRVGCSGIVKAAFRNSASVVLTTSIFFIVFEVLLSAGCLVAYNRFRGQEKALEVKCVCVEVQSNQATTVPQCNGIKLQTDQFNSQMQETQQVQLNVVESPKKS